MKKQPYGVDERCVEIAALFLSDVFATDAQRRELAEDIQKLCEDYCIVLERDKQRADRQFVEAAERPSTTPKWDALTPSQRRHCEFIGYDPDNPDVPLD
jgi:hypothetical protein